MLALGTSLVDRGSRPLLLLAAHLLGLDYVLLPGRVEHHVLKDWEDGTSTLTHRQRPAEQIVKVTKGRAPLELTLAPHIRQSTLVPECVGSSMIVPQYSQKTTLEDAMRTWAPCRKHENTRWTPQRRARGGRVVPRIPSKRRTPRCHVSRPVVHSSTAYATACNRLPLRVAERRRARVLT